MQVTFSFSIFLSVLPVFLEVAEVALIFLIFEAMSPPPWALAQCALVQSGAGGSIQVVQRFENRLSVAGVVTVPDQRRLTGPVSKASMEPSM